MALLHRAGRRARRLEDGFPEWRLAARPLSIVEAVGNIEQLLARPHVRTTGETDAFWRSFRDVAHDALPSGNVVPDAHLVTLMLDNEVRTILTRDRDFRRFPRIEVLDPFA